jgi:type III secretory pathway lipoprotein EscJ
MKHWMVILFFLMVVVLTGCATTTTTLPDGTTVTMTRLFSSQQIDNFEAHKTEDGYSVMFDGAKTDTATLAEAVQALSSVLAAQLTP